jgi:hypothetical protein
MGFIAEKKALHIGFEILRVVVMKNFAFCNFMRSGESQQTFQTEHSLKRQLTFSRLHGVISQKTELFNTLHVSI